MHRSQPRQSGRLRRLAIASVAASTAAGGGLGSVSPAVAVSPDVVVSEVYGGGVRDFVGYGSANDFETAPAPTLSNTTSASRDADVTDTDNNSVDFTGGVPNPDVLPEGSPEPEVLTIPEIQGTGHLSDDEGDLVETSGVTTARSTNGYFVQDPTGDGDQTTSDGIFVFSGSSGAKPAVGETVTVTGTVDEFRPGSSDGDGLKITEITGATFTVTATGVPLPTPVLIGPLGVRPPADVIDNDSRTRIDIEVQGEYQPQEDAIDWYEQFEGMLIQVNDPTAVGPTNNFGEIVVLPRGRNDYIRTPNRGVVYGAYDMPNPRRLLLDDLLIGAGNMPDVNTGDRLDGLITGPLDYGFNNYRMYPTAVPVAVPGGIERETTSAQKTEEVAVASFNVENLAPTDSPEKFTALADIVVDNLQSPDIVALEEVQDNNGDVNDEVVDASVTLDQLVTAIETQGGPSYDYRQINPQDDQDGGEPGGNIRVAFLFRTDRAIAFVDRAPGDATTPTHPVLIDGEVALDHSPGRVDPTNPAWEATRKPLAGEFTWNGEKLFVVANHFSSKGGDEPLFGRWQPPTRESEVKRHQQAASVNGFVDEILALDPDANVVVAGDINDFEFSETIDILTEGGTVLADLVQYLRPRQRYTYVFEGNSQVLDHLLVSPSLFPVVPPEERPVKTRRDYDIVHVNADFSDQVSDHDPQLVRLRLAPEI